MYADIICLVHVSGGVVEAFKLSPGTGVNEKAMVSCCWLLSITNYVVSYVPTLYLEVPYT